MRECNTIAVNEREREGEGQKQSRLTRLNNEKAYANIYPNVMLKMRTFDDTTHLLNLKRFLYMFRVPMNFCMLPSFFAQFVLNWRKRDEVRVHQFFHHRVKYRPNIFEVCNGTPI